MSSASERRTRLILGSILLALATALAFAQNPSRQDQGIAPPSGAQVGPEPGPGKERSGPRNPYRGDKQAAQEGRQLFLAMNCYGCHGGHAGGGMGPSLRDDAWIYGNEDGQIYDSLDKGRSKGMPAWGNQLPEDMLWKLVAYLQTLGTPQETDPPR